MVLGVSCSSIEAAILLLLVLIFAVNDAVRYRVKYLLFTVLSAIFASMFIPFMLFRIRDPKNALLPAWAVTRIVARAVGMNFVIRGKENIVKGPGAVVLINHQSSLDLIVLGHLWLIMDNCSVIAKKAILFFGPFGIASWLWGTIFIDRMKGDQAHNTINATAKTLKSSKTRILMFPEGKRHSGTSLLPFKKGAFHVAITSQTPIQPVVVSRYYFINHKEKRFDSGPCILTILPAIPTEGLTKDDLPQLMERAYEVMNKTFLETSQEALNMHMESLKTAQ